MVIGEALVVEAEQMQNGRVKIMHVYRVFRHERLTYHHTGRDYRLTDVAGKVVKGILS